MSRRQPAVNTPGNDGREAVSDKDPDADVKVQRRVTDYWLQPMNLKYRPVQPNE